MEAIYDLVVVGSGFAGSLAAMIARRLGRSVLLLESGRHPRFAIGESSTPLANLLLEEITTQYSLPRIAPFAKWGSWQQSYPGIACGLKRGFSFFHHNLGESADPNQRKRSDELLVAASPHNRIADVHWYRSEFDAFLVGEAVALGVDYLDEVRLDGFHEDCEGVCLQGTHHGQSVRFRGKFLLDASGPRGFVHQSLGLADVGFPNYPNTQALFTHFRGVRLLTSQYRSGQPPYPINDAAVHHVFEGGWIWVLRFNNGITSAGVAATDPVADRFGFRDARTGWDRLLRELPSLREQFQNATPERDFKYLSRVPFRSSRICGSRWAMLPSAAGFVDPLLSTGFPLTLLGIVRFAKLMEAGWQSPSFSMGLADYAEQTDQDLLAAARMIATLYAGMNEFSSFSSLSLLYFAAASYSEVARRLGKQKLAASFLLHRHPTFGPASQSFLDRISNGNIGREPKALRARVLDLIEPFDVAGLTKAQPRNWYPVDAGDLLQAAEKLHSSASEINSMLDRSGFRETSTLQCAS